MLNSIAKNIIEGEMIAVAGELTYKLMLSIFPLLTFSLSLLGFLDLDVHVLNDFLYPYLPTNVHQMIFSFIENLSANPSGFLLLTSLAVSLLSSSSGFRAMMRGVNICHNTC